jgi:hypothetical protein
LLLRDSCYSAIGWGAYNLYEKINFVDWFKKELIKEIEIKDPRYRIIRRRVCWLLGRWVEKINRDLVLQLTSISALKSFFDDCQFFKQDFAPFLDPFIKRVFVLIRTSQEEETKLKLLHLLALIIEKMDEYVSIIRSFNSSQLDTSICGNNHAMLADHVESIQECHTFEKLNHCSSLKASYGQNPCSTKIHPVVFGGKISIHSQLCHSINQLQHQSRST